MTIRLSPDIEMALAVQARQKGTTPRLLAMDVLRRHLSISPGSEVASPQPAGTLVDFLAGHIGVLHSGKRVRGGARMSEKCGQKLATHLVFTFDRHFRAYRLKDGSALEMIP